MSSHKRHNTGSKKLLNDSKKNESLFLLVEGETEYNYFNLLKKIYNFEISFDQRSKLSLEIPKVKNIIKEIMEKGYACDEIYFVYDTENNDRYINLFKQIGKMKMKLNLIITSSCFEVWFLLHYKRLKPNQFKTAEERLNELKLSYSDYAKAITEKDIQQIFLPLLNTAIANSKLLMKECVDQPTTHTHTNVQTLVDRIIMEKQ